MMHDTMAFNKYIIITMIINHCHCHHRSGRNILICKNQFWILKLRIEAPFGDNKGKPQRSKLNIFNLRNEIESFFLSIMKLHNDDKK